MPVTVENDTDLTPFGAIQEGQGTRFKSPQPNVNDDLASFDRAKSSPDAFAALRTGPEFTLEYEQATTVPVDGSKALLRGLSPFMLQVEPPLVYSQYGSPDQFKRDPGDIVVAAQGLSNPFSSARSHLQATPLGMDRASTQQATDQYLTQNASMSSAKDGTGKTPTDERGRASRRLGTPAIADLKTAVDIANQIKAAVNTPPLIMLINPQSLSMSISKIQQFTDRSRYGYVFHAWGEEQPVLSVETKCGAFYSAGRGAQWASRRDSAAWNNLMALFQFYKNNGYIYDTVGQSNAHHLVGALSIHYDGWVYYGHMSSFSWTFEEANQSGGISVSLEFTVSWMVDTSKLTSVVSPLRSPTANDPRSPRGGQGPSRQASTYPVGADNSPATPATPPTLASYRGFPQGAGSLPFRLVPASQQSVPAGTGSFINTRDMVDPVPQLTTLPPVPFGGSR
ncbi:MAG: hypothetical protein A2Y38_21300 [Spirochaetes bacterium GWB1_59_5]|nr:MAG: hypothetical protein A2Y38_21300 [Spirochaetes bacterium GWB1_59_5]